MKLAVVMPAYNAAATIRSALASLLRQRGVADLDIIVIDDGSTDDTRDIVRDLEALNPEIRLIALPHAGISRTRNTGLRALTPDTDVVTFLDADDLCPAGRYARVGFFDDEDATALAPSFRSHVTVGRVVQLAAGLYRKRIIDTVGLFDETLQQSEDLDYLLRVFETRPAYRLCDEIGVYYRRNHGSVTDNRGEARQELMRAALKARMRRSRMSEQPALPETIFTNEHIGELSTWAP